MRPNGSDDSNGVGRFGSLAAPFRKFRLMAALGCIAAVKFSANR